MRLSKQESPKSLLLPRWHQWSTQLYVYIQSVVHLAQTNVSIKCDNTKRQTTSTACNLQTPEPSLSRPLAWQTHQALMSERVCRFENIRRQQAANQFVQHANSETPKLSLPLLLARAGTVAFGKRACVQV